MLRKPSEIMIGKSSLEEILNKREGSLVLVSEDLSNAYLREVDLSNTYLINVDLTGSDLTNANLANSWFKNTDLRNTDLSGANLEGVRLENTDLRGTIVNGVRYAHETAFFEIRWPENESFIECKKEND